MSNKLDRNQAVAIKQIKWCMRWEIGGIENEVLDGYRDSMPSLEDSVMIVYEGITTSTYAPGDCIADRPIKEIKFCGKEWLVSNIRELLIKEFSIYRK